MAKTKNQATPDSVLPDCLRAGVCGRLILVKGAIAPIFMQLDLLKSLPCFLTFNTSLQSRFLSLIQN
jgi:hypothetical protein